MSNPDKHKKNPLMEWLDEEEEQAPVAARSRSAGKLLKRRFRQPVQNGEAKIEPALMREASQPPRTEEKPSQANSREHLLKQQRMPKLRAPHSTKPARAAGAGR